MSGSAARARWTRVDWGALLIVAVVLAASASGLGNGFTYDDVPIVEQNDRIHSWRWPWIHFNEPYWSTAWGAALYRPVTMLLFALQWQAADWAPVAFHIVNVAAYAVAALLLLRVGRRLMHPGLALAVTALWAAHPVHVEVVANVVGQSELWVAIASLATLGIWQRALDERELAPGRLAAVLGGVAAALGAKEGGIVLPVLLGIVWWTHPDRAAFTPAFRRRIALTLRGTGYVLALYLGARFHVLGALGGDAAHSAVATLDRSERAAAALGFLVTDARLLFAPGRLAADYAPPSYPVRTVLGAWHLVGAAVVVGWIGVVLALRRLRRPIWPACWVPLALAPTLNLFFPSGIVLAERALFVPSLGALLVAGQLADAARARWAGEIRPRVRRLAAVAMAGLVGVGVVRSAERQRVWVDTATLVAASAVDAVDNPRWQRVLGLFFLRLHEWDRAEAHLRASAALARGDVQVVFGMVRLLERQGRCTEALEWYRVLQGEYPATLRGTLGRVACQLRLRRFREARTVARGARAQGFEPVPLGVLIDIADSALVATDSIDGTNGWWHAGRPVSRSDAPIEITVFDSGKLVRHDPAGRVGVPPPDLP